MFNKRVTASSKTGDWKYRCDISVLRIMATLCVIMIHTCNTITNNLDSYAEITEFQLKSLITINALVNWGVPVFFMITGCLLLRDDLIIDYSTLIKRYVKRILIALALFGITFSWMELIVETKEISVNVFLNGILRTIDGNSWGHLWYLYELIGIYLVLPIIKSFTDNTSEKEYRTALLVLFLFNLCFATIDTVYSAIGFYLPIKGNGLFYVMLGRYLDSYKPVMLKLKNKLMIVLCIVILLIIGGGNCR